MGFSIKISKRLVRY